MGSRLAASVASTLGLCALCAPCLGLQETQFVRTLPTAYVPERPMTVFLDAFVGLTHAFQGDVYEVVPAGWQVISSSYPPLTTFDKETGTIFWHLDIESWGELGGVYLSYDVVPPASQIGDVGFEGHASYFFCDWEGEHRGSAATTGDASLSPGPQRLRRVPEHYPSIEAAIDESLFGDTVLIGPGLYVENLHMQQGVDLRADGYPSPEIRATSTSYRDTAITAAPHCSVTGLIISASWRGISCRYAGFEVRNCLITGSTSCGVYGAVLSGFRVVGSTIVANQGDGLHVGTTPSLVLNSVLFGNGGADVRGSGGVIRFCCLEDEIYAGSGENNIYADPVFVNPAEGDYRLQPRSPCIDAGDNSVVSPGDTDLAGNPRIMLGRSALRVDMGAYEYPERGPRLDPVTKDLRLTWSSTPGKTYSLLYSDDLKLWRLADDNVLATGAVTLWRAPLGPLTGIPMRFYRLMENQ